jgi:two-component system, response regulator PdtaR
MITLKPLKVLIAEDQESIRELIRRQLEKIGHTVVGLAINGKEMVELTRSLRPDIVLTDIEMPLMDGLEATRLIQENTPTPVVLLTAHEELDMVQRASRVGAGAYLLKPPSAEDIERAMIIAIARFADLVELRRLNAELRRSLENEKILTGLLPICAHCKSIRNDKGYWEAVEGYITEHTEAHFSHSVCPSCMSKLYPEFYLKKMK